MRVLIVEHHAKPSSGLIGQTLDDMGVEMQTVWGMYGDELPVSHHEHDGIIVLGGNMTALQDEERPYFPALTRLIREFAEADKPVLGVCLGAQLIARSFDAGLHIGGELEFGFHQVEPTPAAAADPVVGALEGPAALFQWHTDHYELPPGAELLATGASYPNQAYRIGRTVYGTQFHFEVTRSLVESQIEDTPGFEQEVPGYSDWLPTQFDAHEEASNTVCRNLTRKWAALK